MIIETTLRVKGKNDYCSVYVNAAGQVIIGSMTIERDEVDDFLTCLEVAINTSIERSKLPEAKP